MEDKSGKIFPVRKNISSPVTLKHSSSPFNEYKRKLFFNLLYIEAKETNTEAHSCRLIMVRSDIAIQSKYILKFLLEMMVWLA
jgi:hypothetical protein